MNFVEHNSLGSEMRSEGLATIGAALSGHRSADLERLFGQCFFARWNTRLQGGGNEPQYLPGIANQPHRLIYRENFFARDRKSVV